MSALLLAGCSHSPRQKYDRAFADGVKHLEKRDYIRATLNFQTAIQAQPREADAYYRLALAYLASGRPKDAIAPLREATELNPNHAQAQVQLADLMIRTHNDQLRKDAETRILHILSRNPGDEDALFTLAAARAQTGAVTEAERHLHEALTGSPGHLRSALALALMKISQKDVASAEQILKRSVAQSPDSVDAAIALGTLYVAAGKLDVAETAFQRATQIDAKSPAAWNGLAATQLRAGRKDAAEETYKKVAALPATEHRLAYVSL